MIRFKATDAPNPKSPASVTPAPAGSAFTVLEIALVAVSVASPPVRTTVPSIAARVV